jgi:hypothetical protein
MDWSRKGTQPGVAQSKKEILVGLIRQARAYRFCGPTDDPDEITAVTSGYHYIVTMLKRLAAPLLPRPEADRLNSISVTIDDIYSAQEARPEIAALLPDIEIALAGVDDNLLKVSTADTTPFPSGETETKNKYGADRWEDIEIVLLSDLRLQFKIGDDWGESLNYADMGFQDRRTEKPNLAWKTLQMLAKEGGAITSTPTAREWVKLEKRIQEIRKVLKQYFNLSDDPLLYIDNVGYRTRFKLTVSKSFET